MRLRVLPVLYCTVHVQQKENKPAAPGVPVSGRGGKGPAPTAEPPRAAAAGPPAGARPVESDETSVTTSTYTGSEVYAAAGSVSSSTQATRRARAKMSLPELGSELDHHHTRFQVRARPAALCTHRCTQTVSVTRSPLRSCSRASGTRSSRSARSSSARTRSSCSACAVRSASRAMLRCAAV